MNSSTDIPVYKKRREMLFDTMPEESIVVIVSPPPSIRNGDTSYFYRFDSNLYYLTGITSEPVVALFSKDKSGDTTYALFANPRNEIRERWEGYRIFQEELVEQHHATISNSISEFSKVVKQRFKTVKTCFANTTKQSVIDQALRSEIQGACEHKNCDPLIAEMRLYKSADEIKLMSEAARVAIDAHRRCMTACTPELSENHLHAELLHTFYSNAMLEAYPSIVASGPRACVLHYQDNNHQLQDGDLVLIDAGAEYQGYSSDVTRVFPVNGIFSQPQTYIYNLVLQAQEAAIAKVVPSNTIADVHDTAVAVLSAGLKDMGFLHGSLDEIRETKSYSKYFMHGTSHWLGLDVHDPGKVTVDGRSRKLEPGMTLTVEPGLYLNDSTLPQEYQNIGIRIEDDVAVTSKQPYIISGGHNRSVSDIETICGVN